MVVCAPSTGMVAVPFEPVAPLGAVTRAAEGVLTMHQHRPRLFLDADRLHRVSHLVADLRRAGRTRGLLDEVYRRLADDALAGRDDLAESLAEMRRGVGRVVRSATTTP